MNFIGQDCPVCNKPFETNSEIVVCPDCGTPHHRQCYNEAGKCFFTDKHEKFKWTNQHTSTFNENNSNINTNTCVRCNFKNNKNALFCENCGLPIMNVTPNSNNCNSFNKQQKENLDNLNRNMYARNFGSTYQSTEKVYDDITAKELADFVKVNPDYYTQAAKRMSVTGKTSFNFSAFFFNGFWLLFRKKYLAGFITIFSFLTLWLISLLIYSKYTVKTFVALYSYLGLVQNERIPFDKIPMVQNFLQILNPLDLFLTILPYIFDLILIAAMIIFGSIANRYYIKACVKQIHKIKSTFKINKEEGKILNEKLSGVNIGLATYSLSIVLLITTLLRYIINY